MPNVKPRYSIEMQLRIGAIVHVSKKLIHVIQESSHSSLLNYVELLFTLFCLILSL